MPNVDTVPAEQNAKLVKLISSGEISRKIAKDVLEILIREGGDVDDILSKYGMRHALSPVDYENIIRKLFSENFEKVEQSRQKPTMLNWFVGQVMKQTGGKANPVIALEMAKTLINEQ